MFRRLAPTSSVQRLVQLVIQRANLVLAELAQPVGQQRRILDLVEVVIRADEEPSSAWAEVNGSNANLRRVSPRFAAQVANHFVDGPAAIEEIIDEQQLIVGLDDVQNVLESLDVEAVAVEDALERLRPDRRVVGIVTLPAKELLVDNPRRRAATPKCDKEIGLNNLAAVHANDAKVEFGSGVDRHENIGAGHIGVAGLEVIMAHPAFRDVPFLLEVPGTDKKGPDREQLDRVKDIRVRVGAT